MAILKNAAIVVLFLTFSACSREETYPPNRPQDFGVSKFGVILSLQYVREKQDVLVTIKNQSEQEIRYFGTDVSGEPNRDFFCLCKLTPSGLKVSGEEVSQKGYSGIVVTLAPQKEASYESPLNPEEMELLKKQGMVAIMTFDSPATTTTQLVYSNKASVA